MQTFLSVVHVLACLFLILVVLLQQGKGGGMGSAFGGGTSQQVFGGGGAGNLLTKLTTVFAGIFMLTSVSLAYLASAGDIKLKAAANKSANATQTTMLPTPSAPPANSAPGEPTPLSPPPSLGTRLSMELHAPPNELTALLGRGTRFEGKLHFEGAVRIDGGFKGEIRSDDVLVIGEGADVEGEIDVAVVIVRGGTVRANIRARNSIELYVPARVQGSLHAPEIHLEKGVQFEGTCNMSALADPSQGGLLALCATKSRWFGSVTVGSLTIVNNRLHPGVCAMGLAHATGR